MKMQPDQIYIVGIEAPDCDGQFADTECDGKATVEVSIELPGMGQTIGVGVYCDACVKEVERRLLAGNE
jgi:hypothetical protein